VIGRGAVGVEGGKVVTLSKRRGQGALRRESNGLNIRLDTGGPRVGKQTKKLGKETKCGKDRTNAEERGKFPYGDRKGIFVLRKVGKARKGPIQSNSGQGGVFPAEQRRGSGAVRKENHHSIFSALQGEKGTVVPQLEAATKRGRVTKGPEEVGWQNRDVFEGASKIKLAIKTVLLNRKKRNTLQLKREKRYDKREKQGGEAKKKKKGYLKRGVRGKGGLLNVPSRQQILKKSWGTPEKKQKKQSKGRGRCKRGLR